MNAVWRYNSRVVLCLFPLLIGSCVFDLTEPLQNDLPVVSFANAADTLSRIERVLDYPDSVVCTLRVHDYNDSIVTFSDSGDSAGSGLFRVLASDTTLGTRTLTVVYQSPHMGDTVSGTWYLTDQQGASATVPYSVVKVFESPLDLFGADTVHWELYDERDARQYITTGPFGGVSFQFFKNVLGTGAKTVGFRSAFKLRGDFSCGVNYQLPSVNLGYTTGFLVSTSPDTSLDSGRAAGVFLPEGTFRVGEHNLVFPIRNPVKKSAGELRIERRDGKVSLYQRWVQDTVYDTLAAGHPFAVDSGLYVHIRITVDGFAPDEYVKSSHWFGFSVSHGEIEEMLH